MNVYVANDGSVQINKRTRIFKGSHNVQTINMIGDFPDYSKIEIKNRLTIEGKIDLYYNA